MTIHTERVAPGYYCITGSRGIYTAMFVAPRGESKRWSLLAPLSDELTWHTSLQACKDHIRCQERTS